MEHALEEMGVEPRMQSRREYLAQLVRRFGGECELDGSEGESEGEGGEGEGRTRKRKRRPSRSANNNGSGESDDTGDEDEEKQDGSARTFASVSRSIHRQMYAPFIHTHSFLGHGSADQGDDVEESNDSIDEEALLREMEEERALDKYDIAKERRAEAWIWRMLKANRGVNTEGSESSESASESTGSTSDSTGSTESVKDEGTDEEESDEGDQAEERKRRKRRKVDDDMEDALIYRAPDGNILKSAVFVDDFDESDDDDDDDE